MNNKIMKTAIFAFLLGSSLAFADSGKVTISSPADGAMVDSKTHQVELRGGARP